MDKNKVLLYKFFSWICIVLGSILFFSFQFDCLMPNNSPTPEVLFAYYRTKDILQPILGIGVVGVIVCNLLLLRENKSNITT